MPEFMSEGYEVLETRDVDGTLVIGVAFIFLAYFLHPAVEFAYHKVRAYRAWRAIEMRRAVEVTNYSMFAEIFGGRGRWDGARIITALLAVFSLASWGLELSVDLARHEGSTDLLNQPPPVEIRQKNDVQVWQVGGPCSRVYPVFGQRRCTDQFRGGPLVDHRTCANLHIAQACHPDPAQT